MLKLNKEFNFLAYSMNIHFNSSFFGLFGFCVVHFVQLLHYGNGFLKSLNCFDCSTFTNLILNYLSSQLRILSIDASQQLSCKWPHTIAHRMNCVKISQNIINFSVKIISNKTFCDQIAKFVHFFLIFVHDEANYRTK